ncbi:MAG: NAD(P)H-hydrate dehydratase [Bacteriovorax sp.]
MKTKKIASTFIKKNLPARGKFSNKTDGGNVLVIGGGRGLYGAGVLAALAATKTGAGYTHLMTDLATYPWVKFPDFIVHPLKLSELKGKEHFAIAIGPGLGLQKSKKKYIEYLLKKNFEKVVIDADAITLLSQMKIKKLPPHWILTPHEGELARLLGVPSQKVKNDRTGSLIKAQDKFGCIVLLKGAETLVIDPTQKIYRIAEGTNALAKAGTGDVLLGIVAAMLAQNVPPTNAAVLASFIHGRGSQLWLQNKNDHLSMRPMDLIELLPKVLYELRKGPTGASGTK